jgi:threonine synthase
MVDRVIVCHGCGKRYPFRPRFEPCDTCEGPLDVEIDLRAAFNRLKPGAVETSGGTMWKFAPFFPAKPENIVTLGEGGTPLLRHARLNALLGLPNLLIKNEAGNPTWSFKDRLNAVNASLAREFGYRDLVALSTGNHGASAAAYASAGGMRSVILLPHGTPDIYGQMIQAYGGIAALTDWHGRAGLLAHLVQHKAWFPSKSALPTPISNPFGLQGYKSIAYEIAIEMRPRVPDYVFVPVGSGDDIYGIFKGFHEFFELGLVDRIPMLVACEPAGTNPVAKALKSKAAHVRKVAAPSTIAISISEGIASDHALRAVHGSAGFSASPTDAEIMDAMRLFASVGLVAESSSCVPLAAVRRIVAQGKLSAEATIVVILTSAGIKWPNQLSSIAPQPVSISSDPAALDGLLARNDRDRCS